jgi:hypothetical protein
VPASSALQKIDINLRFDIVVLLSFPSIGRPQISGNGPMPGNLRPGVAPG